MNPLGHDEIIVEEAVVNNSLMCLFDYPVFPDDMHQPFISAFVAANAD